MTNLRCMVVDDSLVFRKVLRDCLASVSGVEVVAVAGDGAIAMEKLRQHKPDFITLDLEMPVMDGLMVLDQIRAENIDVDVLVVSSLTADGAEASVKALSMGALDVLLKPTEVDMHKCIEQLASQFQDRVAGIVTRRDRRGVDATTRSGIGARCAVRSKPSVESSDPSRFRTSATPSACNQSFQWASRPLTRGSAEIVVIAISTGGPAALQKLLPALPSSLSVPVVIVQHMPKTFTASLARDLDTKSSIKVKEASGGELLLPGIVYIAPAGSQTKIVRRNGRAMVDVNDDPPIRSCKPSADYLFRSAATEFGSRTLGIVMTGMGNDGTEGAGMIQATGGQVIAQDEASCTIYGMPKAVFESGAVNQVMSLDEIAGAILRASGGTIFNNDLVRI